MEKAIDEVLANSVTPNVNCNFFSGEEWRQGSTAVLRLSESHFGLIIPNLARKVVTTGISKTKPIANSSLVTIEI